MAPADGKTSQRETDEKASEENTRVVELDMPSVAQVAQLLGSLRRWQGYYDSSTSHRPLPGNLRDRTDQSVG